MNRMIDIMEGAGFQTGIERTSNMVGDSLFYQAPVTHGWINAENQAVGMTQPFVVNTLSEKIQAEGGQVLFKNIGRQLVRGGVPSGTTGRAQTLQPGGESFALWDVNYSNLPDWYPGQGGYGILEKLAPEQVVKLWEDSVASGAYIKGDTLEEVLEQVGLPVEETMATIERYNELCEAKEDTDFFKRPENLFPIKTPPFYANKAAGTPGLLTILGGLRTDDNMRVCGADDHPIEGLYNVGTMVGDFYSGFYTFQVEGVNYGACCLTFGYLTGKFIAENE